MAELGQLLYYALLCEIGLNASKLILVKKVDCQLLHDDIQYRSIDTLLSKDFQEAYL